VVIVFVVVALALLGLVHYWMWRRLVRDTSRSRAVRRTGAVVFAVLGLLVPVTLIGVRSGAVRWIAWPGYVWIGLMFYLILALALLELVRLTIHLTRRRPATPADRAATHPGAELNPQAAADHETGVDRRLVLARGAAITAGLAAAAVTGYGMKTALGRPQLDRFQIPIPKLPRAMDGTRLAVVSDIHLGPLAGTHHAGRIVDLINSVDADIVCVVGDLVDGTVAELGRFAEPLRDLRSRRGAFFVTGNHEYYSGFQPWVDEVASLGVRPLRNERVPLDGLDLAGVNDLNGTQYGDPPDFARALGDRDPARPVVLMAHQPRAAVDAARYGVDLQVSGHTHGGQMAPFNLVVRLDQPIVSGFGRVDGVPVYVTNGAGFWGPPLRVGAPPQVTVIDLRTP
jgi:uncharacterized protein